MRHLATPALALLLACSSSPAASPGGSGGNGPGGTGGAAGSGGSAGTGGTCADADGDGFTTCDGDCCDSPADGCADPAHVNPGAYDYPANGIDEDCSGKADDAQGSCDDGLAADSSEAADYAKALGLCAMADARKWGLVEAKLTLADGTGSPAAASRAIRPTFGSSITPQEGARLIVLSTGHAAATSDPGFAAFQPGTDMGTQSPAPQAWLAANGGAFPTAPGCPGPDSTVAHDPVRLELRVRVPTNARSLRLPVFFLTAEYPEWVCSAYNDLFVALLTSTASGNPADGNIAAWHSGGGAVVPLGVNLASNTGLFAQCRNGPIGCSGTHPSTNDTCASTSMLQGTGFDQPSPDCSPDDLVGGGTGWITIAGNVTPGEEAVLELIIWDTGDGTLDSVALLDALSWDPEPVTSGLSP